MIKIIELLLGENIIYRDYYRDYLNYDEDI